jgi:hypothetical protein
MLPFSQKLYQIMLDSVKWNFLETRSDQWYEYFANWYWTVLEAISSGLPGC